MRLSKKLFFIVALIMSVNSALAQDHNSRSIDTIPHNSAFKLKQDILVPAKSDKVFLTEKYAENSCYLSLFLSQTSDYDRTIPSGTEFKTGRIDFYNGNVRRILFYVTLEKETYQLWCTGYDTEKQTIADIRIRTLGQLKAAVENKAEITLSPAADF